MRSLLPTLRDLGRAVLRPIALLIAEILGLVPALLAGAGVFLIVAGLFTYLQPANASTASPGPSEIAVATGSAAPYTIPPAITPTPLPSGATPEPTASIPIELSAATRIRIPALGIDMPVIASPPREEFPLCNTAEYMNLGRPLGYPGAPQATYLYAHARTGMFLPLLNNSKVNNGAAMKGMWVEVFSDNNERHVYEITEVIRHVPDTSSSLNRAASATTDELWLQTSEGPYANGTKLQVVAEPVAVLAASPDEAHPTTHGSVCPDAPVCKVRGDSGCRA